MDHRFNPHFKGIQPTTEKPPMIGYIHIRPGQTYSKDAGLQGTPEPKGGVTIAYIHQSNGIIEYATAQCSPKDSYDRARGRLISAGRLAKHVTRGVMPEADQTAPEAILGDL